MAPIAAPIKDRFLALIEVQWGSECWLWTGGLRPNGYGCFDIKKRTRSAHRVAYELFVGPIPSKYVVHHFCETPWCVNPWHLVPMTAKAHKALHAKTHCSKGHPYGAGGRCRRCSADRSRRHHQAHRERRNERQRERRRAARI